ncbi:putative glutamate dehydrogenase, NAD-specific [Helianthus anomalus]
MFVDDSQHFQTSNSTGILGCGSLIVVEVSRNCHDSFGDLVVQKLRSIIHKLSRYLFQFQNIKIIHNKRYKSLQNTLNLT